MPHRDIIFSFRLSRNKIIQCILYIIYLFQHAHYQKMRPPQSANRGAEGCTTVKEHM